jgi:hypothetical protein
LGVCVCLCVCVCGPVCNVLCVCFGVGGASCVWQATVKSVDNIYMQHEPLLTNTLEVRARRCFPQLACCPLRGLCLLLPPHLVLCELAGAVSAAAICACSHASMH